MRAIVDEDTCIGCGQCEETAPEVYELVDDIAKVKLDPIPDDLQDKAREGCDICPVDAISIEE